MKKITSITLYYQGMVATRLSVGRQLTDQEGKQLDYQVKSIHRNWFTGTFTIEFTNGEIIKYHGCSQFSIS